MTRNKDGAWKTSPPRSPSSFARWRASRPRAGRSQSVTSCCGTSRRSVPGKPGVLRSLASASPRMTISIWRSQGCALDRRTPGFPGTDLLDVPQQLVTDWLLPALGREARHLAKLLGDLGGEVFHAPSLFLVIGKAVNAVSDRTQLPTCCTRFQPVQHLDQHRHVLATSVNQLAHQRRNSRSHMTFFGQIGREQRKVYLATFRFVVGAVPLKCVEDSLEVTVSEQRRAHTKLLELLKVLRSRQSPCHQPEFGPVCRHGLPPIARMACLYSSLPARKQQTR